MRASIPVSTLEKFSTFGDLLRYLRRASGLTQLELSVQVGYSHAQISRLEQNLRLPDIPTIEARFVPALDLQDEPRVIARLLELAANVRREDAPGLGSCPYKGLNYFDESDADLFVGRELLTAKLTERVLSAASSRSAYEGRFLAVVGASGSGKSSLVRAGLVPALRWDRTAADWQIHILTPTTHPLANLAAALTRESSTVTATATLMDDLARDSRSLQLFAKRQLQAEHNTHLLLVVDQFEELFTLCRSEQERIDFIANLLSAAFEAVGSVSVVITLRADFYAHCADYIQLREALGKNQEYIGAMNYEELRRAIEEPARRGRWDLEPGLVDLLLRDVSHEPGALPLLSHALLETWQRRRGRTITLSGYASSGGVRGAIAETAETVFVDQFTSEQRSIARRIFLRLTELNDEASTPDTRRRARFSELILKPEEASATHAVLKALADARLIITSEDSAEVAHEALIREWPTLRGWLVENREQLRLHRQLTEAALEWHSVERTPDRLYRGARLAQTREWAAAHQDEMNVLECDFLAASIEASDREFAEREAQRERELETMRRLAQSERQRAEEQSEATRQLRKRAIYLTMAFITALVMAVTALFLGRQEQTASHLATSRELAAASITNLEVDPERSILLALKALEAGYTIEAEDALHRAILTSRIQRVWQAHDPGPIMLALSPDGGRAVTSSADGVAKIWNIATGKLLLRVEGYYAAYSPDGKRLATTTDNGTVKIVDLVQGQEIAIPNRIDAGQTVAFSPDGSRLVTVAPNNTPKIWDSMTGKDLVASHGHTDFVGSAVFSPDGTRILTGSDDGTARVWDAHTGEQLLNLSNHPGWVWAARYSPDGKRIVTLSKNEAYIWDAASGEEILTLTGHNNDLYAVAFSPDGERLATGGVDRKIKIWDLKTGTLLLTLAGPEGAIYSIAFSQDGTQLLSSSDDGMVRVWNIASAFELYPLSTQTNANGPLDFSADGTRLATSDGKNIVKIWDVASGKDLETLRFPGGLIHDIAFSPDRMNILIAGDDTKVIMKDLATGETLDTIAAHTSIVSSIAVSQDGTRLATASDDYRVKVWDVISGKISHAPILTLEHSGKVYSVAFSADGTKVAAGIEDGTIKIWSVATGKELLVLRGHDDLVSGVVFSPDSARIATSSKDGTARIWDASTGKELFALRGHTDAVTSISYAPNGMRLATASLDGTVKVWDSSSGDELLTFAGDGSSLYDIRFSPDGKLLATSSDTGVRIYVMQTEDLIALAKTRVTRSLTMQECQKYLHLNEAACKPSILTPTTTPLPPAKNGRVCQVTNTAGLYDDSFNESIFKGLQDAKAKFSWDARVLQSASGSDFARNIDEFMRGDCDLIIGLYPMMDAIRTAAQKNPNQKFMFSDFVYDESVDNIWMQIYATDQAAFLAGYAAASITRTGKVGVFGGLDIDPVLDYMDGFALGVAYYNAKNGTNVEVLGWDPEKQQGQFVGDFCCAADGEQLTQRLLDQGADIILPVAGTGVAVGVFQAVKTHGGAFVIGVDTDWTTANPEYTDIILTSIVKNYDVSVIQATGAIVDDTFMGGIHAGTLKTGEVGLAPSEKFDSLVSDKVKTDLEQIRKDIMADKIKTKP